MDSNKGEMLWSRGYAVAATRLFGLALDEVIAASPQSDQLARLSRANVHIMQGEFAAAEADLDPITAADQVYRVLGDCAAKRCFPFCWRKPHCIRWALSI